MSRILVATDFSDCSEAATRWALEVARVLGAKVTLLHVWWAPVYSMPDSGASIVPSPGTLAELASRSRDALMAARARLSGEPSNVEIRSVEGPPAETIVRVADGEKFDLLVLGTHGRTGLRHLILGSVAERVVRTVTTPVVTVRAPEAR